MKHRGCSRKKVAFFLAMATLALAPLSAQVQLPVPDSRVDGVLRGYVKNSDDKIVRYELSDTYGTGSKEVNGWLYPEYRRDCYLYKEGSYGQIIRETISFYFLNVKGDFWDYEKYEYESGSSVIVQEATNPPSPPGKPTDEELTAAIEKSLASGQSRYKYKVKTMSFEGEPEFNWYGNDYEQAGYKYTGSVVFTRSERDALSSVISLGLKPKGRRKGTVEMFFNLGEKTWSAEMDMDDF
jgi:hypothetical protein